jgi:hypothetical protein
VCHPLEATHNDLTLDETQQSHQGSTLVTYHLNSKHYLGELPWWGLGKYPMSIGK